MTTQHDAYQLAREQMVVHQIERRGLYSDRLLQAMREVPRHCFVPELYQDQAYEDCPLPIGFGQTISQPYIVALMTSLLNLDGSENVLEVGTGSGYQAAILSRMAKTVQTIEYHPELAAQAAQVLSELEYTNVRTHCGDGSLGLAECAPYHGILITAGAPRPPQVILDQLAPGGKLVLPCGPRRKQVLQIWEREENQFSCEDMIPVAFVPLRGKFGWPEDEWQLED